MLIYSWDVIKELIIKTKTCIKLIYKKCELKLIY